MLTMENVKKLERAVNRYNLATITEKNLRTEIDARYVRFCDELAHKIMQLVALDIDSFYREIESSHNSILISINYSNKRVSLYIHENREKGLRVRLTERDGFINNYDNEDIKRAIHFLGSQEAILNRIDKIMKEKIELQSKVAKAKEDELKILMDILNK